MLQMFHLSKKDIGLSREEVLSLLKTSEHELFDDILIAENKSKIKLEKRLGQTHSIYQFLFKCKTKDLLKNIASFDWNRIFKKNFCVRIHDTDKFLEKDIANLIYHKIKRPVVDLMNPKTKIEFFFREEKVFCGLLIAEIDKSYLDRKAHLRPSMHPTSMHPGLARTMINLTRLEKGLILDPFCGSGGLLIEAGLMGFKTIGYDIDDTQIARAKKNIGFYKIKNCKLEKKDALKVDIKPDAIVTDFPYGKGSVGKNLAVLYERFLKLAYTKTDIAVVMMPDFINYKKIITKTKWKIDSKFELYVHKSLTRVLLVLMKTPYH